MAEAFRYAQLNKHKIPNGQGGDDGQIPWSDPSDIWNRQMMNLEACFHGPPEILDQAWEDILASAEMAVAVMGLPGLLHPTERTLSDLRATFSICLAIRWPKVAHLVRMDIIPNGLGDASQ